MKTHRSLIVGMLLIHLLASAGCDTIKSRFSRQALPDLGPPIPLTAQMELDPSMAKAKTEYLDNCSRIHPFSIGPTVEDTLIQAAHQTFRSVVIPGTVEKSFPAGTFQVPVALVIGQRSASTDQKTSLNAALRDFSISV